MFTHNLASSENITLARNGWHIIHRRDAHRCIDIQNTLWALTSRCPYTPALPSTDYTLAPQAHSGHPTHQVGRIWRSTPHIILGGALRVPSQSRGAASAYLERGRHHSATDRERTEILEKSPENSKCPNVRFWGNFGPFSGGISGSE